MFVHFHSFSNHPTYFIQGCKVGVAVCKFYSLKVFLCVLNLHAMIFYELNEKQDQGWPFAVDLFKLELCLLFYILPDFMSTAIN